MLTPPGCMDEGLARSGANVARQPAFLGMEMRRSNAELFQVVLARGIALRASACDDGGQQESHNHQQAETDVQDFDDRPLRFSLWHVMGTPEIWVDPTSRYTPFGQLPTADQGRLALIAAGNTQELVMTPRADSTSNQSIKKRRIELTIDGSVNVETRDHYRGARAETLRQIADNVDASTLKGYFQNIGSRRFVSDEMIGFRKSSDPATGDFEMSARFDNARIGAVGEYDAIVVLAPGEILSWLPPTLLTKFMKRETRSPHLGRG